MWLLQARCVCWLCWKNTCKFVHKMLSVCFFRLDKIVVVLEKCKVNRICWLWVQVFENISYTRSKWKSLRATIFFNHCNEIKNEFLCDIQNPMVIFVIAQVLWMIFLLNYILYIINWIVINRLSTRNQIRCIIFKHK